MAGLTSTGFTIKRLQEVIADLKTAAQSEFSSLVDPEDIVNVSDTSVLGRWIKTISPAITDLWEVSQSLYSSFDINQASGVTLENLCILGGVTRLTATPTQVLEVMKGVYGTTIVTGSNVKSNVTGLVYTTSEDVTLDTINAVGVQYETTSVAIDSVYSFSYQIDGVNLTPITVSYTSTHTADLASIISGLVSEINTNYSDDLLAVADSSNVIITLVNLNYLCTFTELTLLNPVKGYKSTLMSATTSGKFPEDANGVTSIQSPVSGWESAYNPFAGTTGTNDETDSELRNRYLLAKFQDSNNTYESIYAAILKLNGVSQVVIYENETDIDFSSPPVPAHSFYPIVLGGNSKAIAQAIWDNKPAGILSCGTVTNTIYDSQGVGHDVSFDRPEAVPIYITITIVKTDGWQDSNTENIRNDLITYFNTLKIGDDVIYSRLYTPINGYSGYYVNSLYIDITASPASTSNITIPYNKLANISSSNIIISAI